MTVPTAGKTPHPVATCPRCGREVRTHYIHGELFTHRADGPDKGGICRGSGLVAINRRLEA